MKEILLGVYIGLGIVGLAAIIFSVIVLLYFLAKNNLFFTFTEEGRAKAIMKYNRFHRVVMTYENYSLDYEWTVCEKVDKKQGRNPQGETRALRPEPWFRFGGLIWIGIPFIHSVYQYEFNWASFEQVAEDGMLVQKVIPHTKEIDYILVQDDVYYSFVREAEAVGMVPLNVEMLLTIRIINPYRAFFRIQNWLEATQNRLKPALRDFTATKTFEELVAQTERTETSTTQKEEISRQFSEFLSGSQIDENLRDDYGVLLKKAEIVNIDPAGDRGETYVAAATKGWEADKEKIKIEKLADAEVGRIDRVYTKIQSYGDDGLFIRATEAIEETGRGPSNLVIFPFGSVQSMFEGWLGKKKIGKKKKGGV